jgi:hypothetical protein
VVVGIKVSKKKSTTVVVLPSVTNLAENIVVVSKISFVI